MDSTGTSFTVVTDTRCRLGEGPLWHPDEGCLYWTDIPAARIHRYVPGDGGVETFDTGEPVSAMTLQADGAMLLFMARGAVKTWRDGAFEKTILEELPGERDGRFNDVIADPAGRVFCGTMTTAAHAARLYRLDTDGTITRLLDGIGTSNGMGFTPDRKRMYYTDTRKHMIFRFDYDEVTGAIENPLDFIHVDEDASRPDGMTVDAEGCIWSARWEGYAVVRYDPDGRVMERVALPVCNVTCPAFGGPDLTDLYVTTAGGVAQEECGALAGALFRLTPDVGGIPEFRSRIAV